MKIIISHDVDHLYSSDHWFRDLYYPKLWIRETINLVRRKESLSEWAFRCVSCLNHEQNHIRELIEYEKSQQIKSTFFFGMNRGLGLSYKPKEAINLMRYVKDCGYDIGVHGICYDDFDGIRKERETFYEIMGFFPDGIRMHYVRFDNQTFSRLDSVGYLFDSTEFDKTRGQCLKEPYKVGNMWEFPVCLMDSYLPSELVKAQECTLGALVEAQNNGIGYFTVLLHDCYFSKAYRVYTDWYKWLLRTIKERNMGSISFIEAINELEELK